MDDDSLSPTGRLLVDLEVLAGSVSGMLRARVPRLFLIKPSGTGSVRLTASRRFEIDLSVPQRRRFRLQVPAGDYSGVRLCWEDLACDLGEASRQAAAEHTYLVSLSIRPAGTACLALTLDARALAAGRSLAESLMASVKPDLRRAEARISAGRSLALRWRPLEPDVDDEELPSLRVPSGALPEGAVVAIHEPVSEGLPPLFARQLRLGPVLTVEADSALQAAVEVTVSLDEALLGQAGRRAGELIVMRLDSAQRRYEELHPVRVDTRNRTLTVLTRELSEFFACTPGILVQTPELTATPWDLVGVVAGERTTIAGRIDDERATVRLVQPSSGPNSIRFGWFEFRNVIVTGPTTTAEIEARVEGLTPHTCRFALRAEQPPKRVELTNRLYAPALDLSSDDRPVVSVVVTRRRSSDQGIVEMLAEWQQAYIRPEPFVYSQVVGNRDWQATALLPETYFENESARQVVEDLQLASDAGLPEEERYLATIDAFLRPLAADDPRRGQIPALLDAAAGEFREHRLVLSPSAPVLAGEDDDFSVAFVAASVTGRRLALADGMQQLIRRLHTHPRGEWGDHPAVYAGRLFFVTRINGRLRRQQVADDIWCAGLAMMRDPESGQPVIAALGLSPAAGGQPRTVLRLYRRQPDATWTSETVLDDQPIVDFDVAFAPDGSIRFVAVLPAQDELLKWRMIMVRIRDGAWSAEPLFYLLPGADMGYDLGACPRLHVTDDGRSVVVFVVFLSVLQWVMAVEGPPWRAARVEQARHLDLVGSPFPGEAIVSLDAPVLTSGVSLPHWRPAIVPDGDGGLWCAFGNGMANLVRIDPDLVLPQFVPLASYRLDVDRMTGFSPALSRRWNTAPVIVYKDPFGSGQFGPGAYDEVRFLSIDDGNLSPVDEEFAPVLPSSTRGSLGILRDFRPGQGLPPPDSRLEVPPYVPLDCANIRNPDRFPALLFSVIANCKFQLELYPSGGDYPTHRLNYRLSHPSLARMIEGLASRPTISVFVLDNSEHAEEIERVDITEFSDAVGSLDPVFAADLDQELVTEEIRTAVRDQGLSLSTGATITTLTEGSAWDLIDDSAFGLDGAAIAQTYRVRRATGEDGEEHLELRVPPVVSVVDRAGTTGADGRPTPCGFSQDIWDAATSELSRRFTGLSLGLPDDLPGQLNRVEAFDIRMTGCQPWDPPNDQQGAVRFTFTIPRVTFRNTDPSASGWTTGPSFVHVALAPYTLEGQLLWGVREVEVGVSRFEVDADVGVFSALKWLSITPGLGFLLLAVDPFADSYGRSLVNKNGFQAGAGGLDGVLREALQAWTDRRLGPNPASSEGVYLRNLELRSWTRRRPPLTAGSDLQVLPTSVNFGAHQAGAPLVRRNVLLTNAGNIPALVDDVALIRGEPDMAIESMRQWPASIPAGADLLIVLSYRPQGMPGFRDGELAIQEGGGQFRFVPLLAQVATAPTSPLRMRPPSILFGIVNAGQTADRTVELINDGPGAVGVTAARIDGQAGVYELRNDPTGLILPGRPVPVTVRFRAPTGIGASYEARLVLETMIPGFAEIRADLAGTAAVSELLVIPTILQFNDSPIGSSFPPLPPGLPPTVHLGSTRRFTIGNTGAADLTVVADSFRIVDSTGIDSPHYRLWDDQGLTIAATARTLRGGESVAVVVEFFPQTPGDHPAELAVRTSGPGPSRRPVTVYGHALA